MCGRFTLRTPTPVLIETFRAGVVPDISPRYNVAPTQQVLVVRENPASDSVQREFALMAWGLVPFWAKDPSIGNRLINARSETVAEKPAFRAAMRKRRCLVVADGYFEWMKVGTKKQPYWIRMEDEQPFAMAGLWEAWYGPGGKEATPESDPLLTCTIITTGSNAATSHLHDRMPVILRESDWQQWLDKNQQHPAEVAHLLQPLEDTAISIDAVSTRVNSPKHDDAACVLVQQELF